MRKEGGGLTDKREFIIHFTEKEHYESALTVDKLGWAVSQHHAPLIILTEPFLPLLSDRDRGRVEWADST